MPLSGKSGIVIFVCGVLALRLSCGAAGAPAVRERRNARDHNEERPRDIHKPPGEHADLGEEEFKAEDDRKDGNDRVVRAAAGSARRCSGLVMLIVVRSVLFVKRMIHENGV